MVLFQHQNRIKTIKNEFNLWNRVVQNRKNPYFRGWRGLSDVLLRFLLVDNWPRQGFVLSPWRGCFVRSDG